MFGPDDRWNDDVSFDILVIMVADGPLFLLRNKFSPVGVWLPFLILEIASKTFLLQTNMRKMYKPWSMLSILVRCLNQRIFYVSTFFYLSLVTFQLTSQLKIFPRKFQIPIRIPFQEIVSRKGEIYIKKYMFIRFIEVNTCIFVICLFSM